MHKTSILGYVGKELHDITSGSVQGESTSSDAVLAEISLRSPRKIFIFIIKKIFIGSKYPKNKFIKF